MMLRHISLTQKISRLEEICLKIQKLQKIVTKKKFLTDDIIQKAIERYLQIAIEAAIDICDHIINDAGLRKPADYKDAILILGEAGILSNTFAQRFSHAAGFRNVLVHDYVDIDAKKVFDHFKNDSKDIKVFIRSIVRYLQLRL